MFVCFHIFFSFSVFHMILNQVVIGGCYKFIYFFLRSKLPHISRGSLSFFLYITVEIFLLNICTPSYCKHEVGEEEEKKNKVKKKKCHAP